MYGNVCSFKSIAAFGENGLRMVFTAILQAVVARLSICGDLPGPVFNLNRVFTGGTTKSETGVDCVLQYKNGLEEVCWNVLA